jgi:uncharacterized protein YcbK (DUF882 family)
MGGGGSEFDGRSRRDFLKLGGAAALGLFLGRGVAEGAETSSRSLSFYNTHTAESLTVEYFARGRYQPDGLSAVNRLMRDHHTDQISPIDPRLLDIVWVLRRGLGSREQLHVVSGYRSYETNAIMRAHSRAVARDSFHCQGRAVDFFMPDRELRDVHVAALTLAAGGVGYYPGSNFVHVDTGPVRTWGVRV